MKTGFQVADVMTKKPISLSPKDTLQKCAQEMAKQHVGAMVLTEGNELKGILTEQDMVRKVVAKGVNPLELKIKDVMESDVKVISPEKDIFEALIMMKDLNIRHLPVVDGKNMIGFVTLKDILKIEPQLFDLLVEKFEIREAENKPLNSPREKEGVCNICGKYAEEIEEQDGIMVCDKCKEK